MKRLLLTLVLGWCGFAQPYTSVNGVALNRASFLRHQRLVAAPKGLLGDPSLLVHFLDAEGNDSAPYDYSGRGMAITWVNPATWAEGKIAPWAVKVGAGLNRLDYPPSVNWPNGSAITLTAWFKEGALANWNQILQSDGWCNTDGGWAMFIDNGTWGFTFGVCHASEQHNADGCTAQLTTGAWHWAVGTYDGTTVKSYIDNNFCNGYSVARVSLDTSHIFRSGTPENNPYELLNDVRVYNRVLSSAELTAIYNATKGY